MDPKVVAVVLSWNLKDRVLECMGALSEEKSLSAVILVDNGSSDGTPQAVREAYPSVIVMENATNTGYAAGNNAGIRRAIEMGAQYVFMLNSDAVPEAGAVDMLIRAAVEENAGVAGGKPLRRNDPSTLDAAWGVVNWRNFASRLEGEGAKDGQRYSVRRKVDYPLGVAMVVSVKALNEVGLFDESYFAYHEEMELCERMRRAGYAVIFEPARFLHGGSESLQTAGAGLGREYLLARNSVKFISKYASLPHAVKFWTFVIAASILKLPLELIRGRLGAHFARIRGWRRGRLDIEGPDEMLIRYGFLSR